MRSLRSLPAVGAPLDIALVTCSRFPDLPGDDQRLLAELRRRGRDAAPVVWDDPEVRWSDVGVAVVRATWDYTGRRDEFLGWAQRAGEATLLLNDPDVLRWNTHKGYLMELEDRGVPIVPTAWTARGDRVDLGELCASRGWGDVVLKPAVSAGAEDTHRVRAGEVPEAGQRRLDDLLTRHDVLVQPYLVGVEQGEVSLLYADGVFTHAVTKRPSVGDFRVQEELGGATRPFEPGDDLVRLGSWIVESTGHEYLYARVDVMPADDGTWQLAELEVAEPSLYLAHAPGVERRYADAIESRLAAARPGPPPAGTAV